MLLQDTFIECCHRIRLLDDVTGYVYWMRLIWKSSFFSIFQIT